MVWYNPLGWFRNYEAPKKEILKDSEMRESRSRLKEIIDGRRKLLAFQNTARASGIFYWGRDFS